jgi:hypothetical protein
MTRSAATAAGTGDRLGLIGLGVALVGLIVLLISFRGLLFVSLPLAIAAFVLGCWATLTAVRPLRLAAGYIALVLGVLLLVAGAAAVFVELNANDRFDVYERQN